jgi:hypothetical protein
MIREMENPATSLSSSERVYRCLGLALQAAKEEKEWKFCGVSQRTCQVGTRERELEGEGEDGKRREGIYFERWHGGSCDRLGMDVVPRGLARPTTAKVDMVSKVGDVS